MIKILEEKEIRIEKYWYYILTVTIFTVGIITGLYLHYWNPHSLYFYQDSVSHAVESRAYVDSDNPGFFQHLYTSPWLPLPHLFLLPITQIDLLFRTGFAGLLISLTCHVLSCLFLYKIINRHVGNCFIAIAGVFLYGINPNILYLALVSMTESPFMLMFIGSAYYFQEWMFNMNRNSIATNTDRGGGIYVTKDINLSNLVKASVMISLATLCRYESWVLSISFIVMVISVFILCGKKHTLQNRKHVLYSIGIVSVISLSGIILWLSWNAYIDGDPLNFLKSDSSALSHALKGNIRGNLFLQPKNVFDVYGKTMLYVFGPVLLVGALLGCFAKIFSKSGSKNVLIFLFLVMPSLFTIFTMIGGISEMNLSKWYNSRFVILSAPLIIILNCVFISHILTKTRFSRIKSDITKRVIIIAIFFSYLCISPLIAVPTLIDAIKDFSSDYVDSAIKSGRLLSSVADRDDRVVIIANGDSKNRIMVASGLPLKNFYVVSGSDYNSLSSLTPWMYGNYLVMSKVSQGDIKSIVNYWTNRQHELDGFYNRIYEDRYHTVLSTREEKSPSCIRYNASSATILIECKSINISSIYEKFKGPILMAVSPKTWILNANLEIMPGSTLHINSSDSDWLKINSSRESPSGIKVYGDLFVDSVRISGWNTTSNDYARTDDNGSVPRSNILADSKVGRLIITNSDIGYLGYNKDADFGLTFNDVDTTIKNSKIHDLYYGLKLGKNVNGGTIENNEFYNSRKYGIHAEGKDLSIKYNKVYGNGEHGIMCTSGCYNVVIDSNRVFNNSKEGIILYSNVSNSDVKNNTVSDNRDQVAVYQSSDNNTITNNTMTGGNVGIRVSNSSNNFIYHNHIMDAKYGIYIVDNSSDNEIDFNNIDNSLNKSILLQGSDAKTNLFKSNNLQ